MRKCMRNPRFWILLIVASFAVNVLVALITVHQHLLLPMALPIPVSSTATTATTIPEEVLWHRMLQEQPDCSAVGQHHHHHHLLPAFGFRRDVERFLLEGTKKKNTTQQQHRCFQPTAPSCHVQHYSVILISAPVAAAAAAATESFHPHRRLRQLVLYVMSFLSYPSANGISVILSWSSNDMETLANSGGYYGAQLVQWHTQGTIQLLLVVVVVQDGTDKNTTLWSALQEVQARSPAVVLVNGNLPRKDWNGSLLKTKLYAWRSSPTPVLVSSSSSSSLSSSIHNNCSIPSWHGLVMDRSLLCYLGHPLVQSVRRRVVGHSTTTTSWHLTLMTVAALWTHFSSGGNLVVMAPSSTTTSTSLSSTSPNNTEQGILRDIASYLGCGCSWPTTTVVSATTSFFLSKACTG